MVLGMRGVVVVVVITRGLGGFGGGGVCVLLTRHFFGVQEVGGEVEG